MKTINERKSEIQQETLAVAEEMSQLKQRLDSLHVHGQKLQGKYELLIELEREQQNENIKEN